MSSFGDRNQPQKGRRKPDKTGGVQGTLFDLSAPRTEAPDSRLEPVQLKSEAPQSGPKEKRSDDLTIIVLGPSTGRAKTLGSSVEQQVRGQKYLDREQDIKFLSSAQFASLAKVVRAEQSSGRRVSLVVNFKKGTPVDDFKAVAETCVILGVKATIYIDREDETFARNYQVGIGEHGSKIYHSPSFNIVPRGRGGPTLGRLCELSVKEMKKRDLTINDPSTDRHG